jgi:hypothetical protein
LFHRDSPAPITVPSVPGLAREIRQYGLANEGDIARQVMLGVVQTADGLPIHHEVFAGNAAETHTLARYPVRRVVLVADRGLLSLDKLEAIQSIKVHDQPLEFILAVAARRYSDFDELLATFHDDTCLKASTEVIGEFKWQGHRLLVAHRPDFAAETGARRDKDIAELEQDAARWADKLDGQGGAGARTRARSSPTAVPRRLFIRQSAKRSSHRSSGLI